MIGFFKTKRLRHRCRLLAVEWIKDITCATEEQALKFVDNCEEFDDDFWFDNTKPDEYNTDRVLIRAIATKVDIDLFMITEGYELPDLPKGFIGFRSAEQVNDFRITFILGSTYAARLMADVEGTVPTGFLSGTVQNTQTDLLKFVADFWNWKDLRVITGDKRTLSVSEYFTTSQ